MEQTPRKVAARPMKHMRMSSRAYDGEPRAARAPRLNAAKQRGAAPQKPAQIMHLDELEAHLAQLPPQPKARRARARALAPRRRTSDVGRRTSKSRIRNGNVGKAFPFFVPGEAR